jgi:hypothetical protein
MTLTAPLAPQSMGPWMIRQLVEDQLSSREIETPKLIV